MVVLMAQVLDSRMRVLVLPVLTYLSALAGVLSYVYLDHGMGRPTQLQMAILCVSFGLIFYTSLCARPTR